MGGKVKNREGSKVTSLYINSVITVLQSKIIINNNILSFGSSKTHLKILLRFEVYFTGIRYLNSDIKCQIK